MNRKSKIFSNALLAVAVLALPSVAFAGGNGNTDAGGMELVTYMASLLQGWLGMLLAIVALIAGIVSGLVQRNLWGLLFAWAIALACYKGPDFILSQFTGVL